MSSFTPSHREHREGVYASGQAPEIDRARAEFLEMPGLRLTPRQGARLFGTNIETASTLLESLASSGFLRRTPSGYLRA